jgi:hypothetical protein
MREQWDIEYKTPEQVVKMRAAGLLVAATLDKLRVAVAPGVSTADLDALAEETIRAAGGIPSFLGYQGYPASDLLLGQQRDRARHPEPEGGSAGGRRHLDRLRGDPGRLARGLGDHRTRG